MEIINIYTNKNVFIGLSPNSLRGQYSQKEILSCYSKLIHRSSVVLVAIFISQGYSFQFILSLYHNCGLGFGVGGFGGLGCLVDRVGSLWCKAFLGFWSWGSFIYIHRDKQFVLAVSFAWIFQLGPTDNRIGYSYNNHFTRILVWSTFHIYIGTTLENNQWPLKTISRIVGSATFFRTMRFYPHHVR